MSPAQIKKFIRRELKGLHGSARRKAYGAARRKVFTAAGLRSDGAPRAVRKPCGCLFGSCMKCAKPDNKLIYSAAEIKAMWADYEAGMTMSAVGRKYGKSRKTLDQVFRRRGYQTRPVKTVPKLGFGVKIPPATEAEIELMIARLKRLGVPEELKHEWRQWSLEKRHAFIKRLRIKFPSNRPTGEYSSNVEPFEYGTPRVHEIAARMNQGRNSRTKVIALKPCSEGVIWEGQIFFWDKNDSYVRGTGWRPGTGRPLLGHLIWEQANGRPVPDKMTVIHKDGNKNNFAPENLALRSKADCARMNSIPMRLKKDPKNPELLAKAQLRMERIVTTRLINKTRNSRAHTAALVKHFQHQSGGVIAALQRRAK